MFDIYLPCLYSCRKKNFMSCKHPRVSFPFYDFFGFDIGVGDSLYFCIYFVISFLRDFVCVNNVKPNRSYILFYLEYNTFQVETRCL